MAGSPCPKCGGGLREVVVTLDGAGEVLKQRFKCGLYVRTGPGEKDMESGGVCTAGFQRAVERLIAAVKADSDLDDAQRERLILSIQETSAR